MSINVNFENLEKFIDRIWNTRKGIPLMICFICIFCFIFDWFYLKPNINNMDILWNFRQIYCFVFFFAFIWYAIKIYNSIADFIEEKRELKYQEKQENEQFLADWNVILPIIEALSEPEKQLLKIFIDKKSLEITVSNDEKIGFYDVVYMANIINAKLNGMLMIVGRTLTHTLLRIDRKFYRIIYQYFNR